MLEKLQQTINADGIFGLSFFLLALRVKAYLCCFTQFTVDQSKLTVNGSGLSDTPNVRYLVALYNVFILSDMKLNKYRSINVKLPSVFTYFTCVLGALGSFSL